MKLVTKQDIEAPVAFVYRSLTDFEAWETAAMRRGAEVARTDTLTKPGPGMSWRVKFDFKGRARTLLLRLAEADPGNRVRFTADSPSVGGDMDIELMELSPRRTRMTVRGEVSPKTLAARIFVQSMKIAKGKVQRRYEQRIAQMATEIEERHRRQRG